MIRQIHRAVSSSKPTSLKTQQHPLSIPTQYYIVGLGDATDGDAEETTYEDAHVHVVEETAYEDTSVHEVFSSLEKIRGEKLPHIKRTRTAPLDSTKAFDEVNTVTSDHIFDMIQKMWEKESEEKDFVFTV